LRIAVWTAEPEAWPADLVRQSPPGAELVIVARELAVRADLHVYDVTANAGCGFVYRALLREPGLVVLSAWNLHDLVYAETAGRGAVAAYLREMRRAHGATGSFVARQVQRELGGALTTLTPLNARVLEASLAVVATSEAVAALARRSLRGRPVVQIPLGRCAPHEAGAALVALARELAPRLPEARRALAAGRALEATPLGRALAEILPIARELGQDDVPGLRPLVASLFPEGDRRGAAAR
jgi:hypothetical protein